MELPEFRRRFSDEELSMIYADPNAGGLLKEILYDVHVGQTNLIQAATAAVAICRDRFAPDVDPLFFDHDFLYAFLSTWMLEDSFHDRFKDEENSMLFLSLPALCYAIYDHGKWIAEPTAGWLKCADAIAWEGVMPTNVLHRGNEGFQSCMVAYRNSPIWDRLGFSGRKIAGIEAEPFPFESDYKVRRCLSSVDKVAIRKMYVRVGLPDPKAEVEIWLQHVRQHIKQTLNKNERIRLDDRQRKSLQLWHAEKEAIDDKRVLEPDPPSFEPPLQKVPDRSYAYDNAITGASEARRIITNHMASICMKSLWPILKVFSQIEYMKRLSAQSVSTGTALTLYEEVRNGIAKLVEAYDRLAEVRAKIESKSLWLQNQKLPVSLDDWPGFEESMYNCSMEVSELHGEASRVFQSRIIVKTLRDSVAESIGKLVTVRKSAIADLWSKAKLMYEEGETEKGFTFLMGAAASGDASIYREVADKFMSGKGVPRDETIGRAFLLVSQVSIDKGNGT